MVLYSGFRTPAEIQQSVAEAAKARRLALNITQSRLAAQAGVSSATLKRFEKDGSAGFAAVLAIAEALDALDDFQALFPLPNSDTLDALEDQTSGRLRASRAR